MLRAMKSYWAFTNGLYKLVMLLVVPILLIIVNMYLVANGHGDGLATLFILYFVDTMSDLFFMNGFYQKGNSALEFMQSSSKFPAFVKDITIVDIVRRVLVYQIPFLIEVLNTAGSPEKLEWCRNNAFWPWLASLFAQLVVLVARHYTMWNHVYACTAAGYAGFMFSFLLVSIVSYAHPVAANGFLMCLLLVVSIITVWYTHKKVRESYYDK